MSVDQVTAELDGLPVDQFFELSFQHLLVRNLEYLTELGLAETLGLCNDRLNDLSESYAQETHLLRKTMNLEINTTSFATITAVTRIT
ncbi:MAG: hypothetical protein JSV61_15115 [Anaerolineales bacterium]|nr:MAG: hypothetical protein JSV61_15115 [Anaerolineales bacterium]